MSARKLELNVGELVQSMKENSKPKDVAKARRDALAKVFSAKEK